MLEKLTTVPLVIAAHGTRDPEGVTACRALAERVRTKLPGTKVTIGFIELAEPRIPEAVADALKDSAPRGGAEAVVVPLMLASGGHVRIDIPEAIDKGRGNSEVAYSAALLGSPLLDSAVRRRVVEALGEWRPQDTACVLVGRGSSVVESNAERYRMARVLMEEAGLRSIHPAFIQVSRPSVPEALNHAKATGVKQIVVAPHFLFPGKLRTWNLDQVAAWRENNPDVEVRVAEVIGDCNELAQLVVDRYLAELDAEGFGEGAPGFMSSIVLQDRDVLVVGGGAVAARRIPRLLEAGAKVRVVAPNLGIPVGRLAASGAIAVEQRTARAEDVGDAWYVLAACNDPHVNAMIAAEAERRHTFCCRADDALGGTAMTPATASAGGLTVAVIGDRNPRRSVRIRDELLQVLQG